MTPTRGIAAPGSAAAVDGRRGPARRRLLADRLPGVERPRQRRRGHPRPGARGHADPRLPARTAAARALQQRPLPHHRRDHVHAADLRQHAHAGRDRDRGGARRLLGHADAGRRPDPARRVRRLPAAERAGRRRRRDHRLEAHLLDQAEFALPPGIPVVVIDSERRARLHRRRHRPGAAAPARPPSTCSASATARSGTSPARETSFSAARRGRVLAAHAARGRASRRRRCCAATGRPNPATDTA